MVDEDCRVKIRNSARLQMDRSAMKTIYSGCMILLLSCGLGCSVCSHPFDYSYAAYDDAQMYGERAGSAFAPGYEGANITGMTVEEDVAYYGE